MPPLCHSTLEARIKGIAGEEGEDVGLIGKARVGAVIVHKRLEAGDSADWFCRARSKK